MAKLSPFEMQTGLENNPFTKVQCDDLEEGDIVMISLTSRGADLASNRALFGIMGGFGEGGDRKLQVQPNRSGSNR